jgi:predicted DNA-binding transcriptional regulator AlpA
MKAMGCATAISNEPRTVSETDDYITVRDIARRSSMSEKSIRDIIRNDALPHYRRSASGKILVRWSDFEAWMERRRIELKHDDCLLGILRDMKSRGRR